MAKKFIIIATAKNEDLDVLENYCRTNNFIARSAHNFNDLLKCLSSPSQISLLMLDIDLPKEGANRIISMLRAMPTMKYVPILVLAGKDTDESTLAKILDVGADEFLRHPFLPSILKTRISSVLREKLTGTTDLQHYAVLKNLFRLMVHDVSNLFINFEIFMNSIEKKQDQTIREKKLLRARATLSEIRSLLKNLKTLDAIKSQKLVPKIQAVNIAECITEVHEIYFDRLEEKNLKLIGNWNSSKSLVLSEAVSLKHQVIGNLLTNAIKFSHPGSNIEVDLLEQESSVIFSIRDHGIGVPLKNIEFMFVEGANGSRTGTKGEKGTGYGLPLVQEYVKAYDAQIEVSSMEKQHDLESGTTFRIVFKKAPGLSP